MLPTIADRISSSPARRHSFLAVVTVVTIFFAGYHFGTFDQAIHIPFLKKTADPALFPGDAFLNLRQYTFSYFWLFFVPLYRIGVLEVAMFLVHVLVTYGTFWMLWDLSESLFHSHVAAVLTTVGFIFPHLGLAGFPILEFSLLNRTFVLPFLLLAIILWLRHRYLLAFGLLGLMYNLHVISAQFVLAMFLLDAVLEFGQLGLRNLVLGLLLFGLAAAPVLIWKFQAAPVDLTLRPAWMQTIARGMLYNLFYWLAPYPPILIGTVSGLSSLAMFWIGRSAAPPAPQHRTLGIFVVAALIILGVQVVSTEWLPATILVQSQIIRVGIFLSIFGFVYFANYLAQLYAAGRNRGDLGALAAGYLLSLMPAVPVGIWVVQRWVRSLYWKRTLAWGLMAAGLVSSFVIAGAFNLWVPGLHIYGPKTAWEDAQLWARDHTPLDALFITPPQLWWLYQSDWRVFSERSTVATWSELLEAPFDPNYLDTWTPRFEALAPGALAQFQGNVFDNQRITALAFYRLSTADFTQLGRRFGASYLVVEKPHTYDLPLVYENQGFRIYALAP